MEYLKTQIFTEVKEVFFIMTKGPVYHEKVKIIFMLTIYYSLSPPKIYEELTDWRNNVIVIGGDFYTHCLIMLRASQMIKKEKTNNILH